MQALFTFGLVRRSVLGLLLLALAAWALPVQAQLFGGDDQARRAIIELRERVEANRSAAEQANQALQQQQTETIQRLDEDLLGMRRSLVELGAQNDALRRELAELRGLNERLAHALADVQRQQRDWQGQLDQRLRPLEPLTVTVEGVEFQSRPEEVQAFDAAMVALRASDFVRAARLFGELVAQFPRSGYVAPALYWQGNAQYAARQHPAAIETFRRMIAASPRHPRVPDALLGIANAHIELRDNRAARAALQELIQAHPNTEAASVARERLTRLR
ncbi:MAG: tol-pal system protein YbgF [Serpentinimonas sp.]|nr:tol-pal system protein YbgF [Serpentinimonas sp.]